MALFNQMRFWKSQAIYWRYAIIADPTQPLPVRRLLAKMAGDVPISVEIRVAGIAG